MDNLRGFLDELTTLSERYGIVISGGMVVETPNPPQFNYWPGYSADDGALIWDMVDPIDLDHRDWK